MLVFTTNSEASSGYITGTCNVYFDPNYIIVAGGGVSGTTPGGGGIAISSFTVNTDQSYSIKVGSGGSVYTNYSGDSSNFGDYAVSGGTRDSSTGGTSVNGGVGGNSSLATAGGDSAYTTSYGTTYKFSGVYLNNNTIGEGANGTGGRAITYINTYSGQTYGAGGGGARRSMGHSGIVILYW